MDRLTLPAGYQQSEHVDNTFTLYAEIPARQEPIGCAALAQQLGLGDAYVDKFVPGMFTNTKRWNHCRLSSDEWAVAHRYFPKCYGFEGDALATFAFQELPEPVLRVWREAWESCFFEHFQLRTTEGQGPDAIPSLVGTLDSILLGFCKEGRLLWPYRLAQFGMDDPMRASMRNMARAVRLICLKGVKPDKVSRLYEIDAWMLEFLAVIGAIVFATLAGFVTAVILSMLGMHLETAPGYLLGSMIGAAFVPSVLAVSFRIFEVCRLRRHFFRIARGYMRKQLEAIDEAAAAKRIFAA